MKLTAGSGKTIPCEQLPASYSRQLAKTLYPSQGQSKRHDYDSTPTDSRRRTAGARHQVRRTGDHPACPLRLPRRHRSPALQRGPPRPHHRHPPGNPGCGVRGDQAGARLEGPRARPIRTHRRRRGRRSPVARLFADVEDVRGTRRDHREGHPGRQGQQPPGPPCDRRHHRPTRPSCRGIHPRRARSTQDPVRHRGQRCDAGHGDAAQHERRRRRGGGALRADRRRRHLWR